MAIVRRRTGAVRAALAIALASGVACSSVRDDGDVGSLSDRELVDALEAVSRANGATVDRVALLAALKPQPAYVLSSSTATLFGTVPASYAVYSLPTTTVDAVYGDRFDQLLEPGRTTYHHLDCGALSRLLTDASITVRHQPLCRLRSRGAALIAEVTTRIERRRAPVEDALDDFFATHPDLSSKRMLLASVLAWGVGNAPAGDDGSDSRRALESAAQTIASLPRGRGLAGPWYGAVAHVIEVGGGDAVALNSFLRVDLTQQGTALRGRGVLGSGEAMALAATLEGDCLKGVAVNKTGSVSTRIEGRVRADRVVFRFAEVGDDAGLKGFAVLVR
jgi:hypothetical protein